MRKPVDEPFTYAYMIPMVKEMRVRRQIVDGVERDELYEVMVPKEVEPLFLGPDGVNQRRERRKRAEAEARRAEAACRF